MIEVRKISCILFFSVGSYFASGCVLAENLTSNVGGWDVSACVSGFDTCWELFSDNADKFEGGFLEAMGSVAVAE